jgi:hypothetical protein
MAVSNAKPLRRAALMQMSGQLAFSGRKTADLDANRQSSSECDFLVVCFTVFFAA